MSPGEEIKRAAVVSADSAYRYLLTRRWDDSVTASVATFVMLNPSTADAEVDDPTIRRCIRFARDWGHGALQVVNLYAFRATKPADLWAPGVEPIGGEAQMSALRTVLAGIRPGDVVVAAWGANADPDHARAIAKIATERGVQLRALAVNKDGSPCHPLYQPASAVPVPWLPDRVRSMSSPQGAHRASELRAIANSIEPLYPTAADLLRGIAKEIES